ncbi:intradiol ring-cleavage dioxygenase [Tomitella gaofuii]|uniref:intradiol ring-cleavage dioxygenase n=1 Tax=Tomitella gaofuii TaxID=2760083 RepID=UPI002E2E8265|nr:intradiol ring-cleavage dioxygenase [Tomitella gaofuii]
MPHFPRKRDQASRRAQNRAPCGPDFEGRPLDRPDEELVDQGAAFDAATLITRRRVLAVVGIGAGTAALAACSSGGSAGASSARATGTQSAASTTAEEIPEETNGPYPADGTQGVNVLDESGIVRSDITTSLDGGTTVDGVPLSFTFTVTDSANADAAFEGAAVYVWQCDSQGRYSMYTEGVEDETYLRGVQVADADGRVSFTTIVPACYAGRWPHVHFEVYPDVDSATSVSNAIATSQVAFPQDMADTVYALDTYSGSAANLAQLGGIENDNVFGDGHELQLGTFTGDAESGYVGSLSVAVDTTTEPSMSNQPPGGGGGQPPAGGPGGQPPEGGGAPGGPPAGASGGTGTAN